MSATPVIDYAPAPLRHPRRPFAYWHEVTLALLLISLFIVARWLEPGFVTSRVQLRLAEDIWPMALLTLPMMLIVLTGGIDLSIGAIVALCSVVCAMCLSKEIHPALAVTDTLAVGLLCGAVNGVLVAILGVHPLIVTLGTMAMVRGIALAISGGFAIPARLVEFGQISQGEWLGLSYPLWMLIAALIVTTVFLSLTSPGRFIRAIGYHEPAARLCGAPARGILFSLHTLSGLMSAAAAILMVSRYGQGKADMATALELEVITAVVLGGVSIFGGRGTIVGVVLGVLLMHEAQKFVTWHWRRTELNALVVGGLLIGSVLINSLRTRWIR